MLLWNSHSPQGHTSEEQAAPRGRRPYYSDNGHALTGELHHTKLRQRVRQSHDYLGADRKI